MIPFQLIKWSEVTKEKLMRARRLIEQLLAAGIENNGANVNFNQYG